MREERTSRCGWEVLTRRSQPNNPEDDDDDAGTAPGSPNIRVSEILNIFYEIFLKLIYIISGERCSRCVVLVESDV